MEVAKNALKHRSAINVVDSWQNKLYFEAMESPHELHPKILELMQKECLSCFGNAKIQFDWDGAKKVWDKEDPDQ